MKDPVTLTVTRIGNSRGVRLPARVLRRYGIGDAVLMEERDDGILLRPVGSPVARLTWEQTAREMAREAEDWSEWDAVLADGLALWHDRPARVAEPSAARPGKARRRR